MQVQWLNPETAASLKQRQQDTIICRWIFGSCAVLSPLFRLMYGRLHGGVMEPLIESYGLILLYSSFCLLTYNKTFTAKHLYKLFYTFCVVVSLHLFQMAVINNFTTSPVLALYIGICGCSLVFRNHIHLRIYHAFAVTGILVTAYFNESLQLPFTVYLTQAIFVVVMSHVLVYAKVKMESNVIASEIFAQSVFNSASDAFLIIDKDSGLILNCNSTAVYMFEASNREELVGQSCHDLEKVKFSPEIIKNALDDVKTKGAWKIDYEYKTLKQQPFWANIALSRFTQLGKTYLLMRISNINDTVLLEQKKNALLQELQIVNNNLESFSYSISHDLRTPLRGISTMATFIKQQYGNMLDEEGKSYLNQLLRSTKKMDRLISDLLTFSKLGKQALIVAPVDMEALVKGVIEDFKLSEPKNKARFKLNSLPASDADARMITQVFQNLLSNAAKYSSTKENPIVEIGSYKEDSACVYFVKDNGTGFNMKYYDKLFKVFQRLHNDDDFEGTGIGLAIVSRVVERHGGRVWAESVEKEGATFYFTLPNGNH